MTNARVLPLVFRYFIEEKMSHERESENVFYVTDLTQCPIKRLYSMKYPELSAFVNLKPAIIIGSLVHYGISSVFRKYNIEPEVENERTVKDHEGNEYIVKGRIDGLMRDKDGKLVGIEVKTSKRDDNLPYEHHIEQAKLYNWLFTLDKTLLVYFTPKSIIEFEVTERVNDDYVISCINNPSAPKYDWECKYCPFAQICTKSNITAVRDD